ncbi:MAG: serine/threonine protein kinase, partial [Myxococcaceae bacterium]|nr:serine/threonine protein kinase [Myxococcaceae bacterium]
MELDPKDEVSALQARELEEGEHTDADGADTEGHDGAIGRYETLLRLGEGGMAEVLLALARGPAGFNKLAVVKRLLPAVAKDSAYCDMFLDEARLAARLNHPNVVLTYEVAEHEGSYFIAMEYLEGQPLHLVHRELKKRGLTASPALMVKIISEALCGLHYAHEVTDLDGTALKIVHRDVSPQNIFVTYDGRVVVVDFGIAKAERSVTKTQAGVLKGKAAYMAPEQLLGDEIDRRVDIFTAGTVLWELLTGRRLMAAGTHAQTLLRVLQDRVPRVSSFVPDIDPALDDIVARALARSPDDRYATALEMKEALDAWMKGKDEVILRDDVGAFLTSLFGEERSRVQNVVRDRISALGARVSGYMPASRPSVSSLSIATPLSALSLRRDRIGGARSQAELDELAPPPSTASMVVSASSPLLSRAFPSLSSLAPRTLATCLGIGVGIPLVLLFLWRASAPATSPPLAPTTATAATNATATTVVPPAMPAAVATAGAPVAAAPAAAE